ncbi:ATP-binding protein [Parasedimentitalea maritima]|uniref:histidine kinase n=1 Tax=Parasedimentitalea maritima TaxID=2578117 RepID=A0A6A4RMZ8_9RHOB|nr:ATP-binding protein [Zongyanglinia marina]KAE9631421.1 response regulator [Zongyanglinia marina]
MKVSIKFAVFSIVALAGLVMLSLIGLSRYTLPIGSKVQAEIFKISHMNFALGRFQIDFLRARRAEKDFLLRLADVYALRHAKFVAKLHITLEEIQGLSDEIGGMGEITLEISTLTSAITAYQENFAELVHSNRRLGYDETSGLQGQLRRAVHGVEAALTQSDRHELTAKMLMMRRHEKDFIMRVDVAYLKLLNARVEEFHSFPVGLFESAEQQAEINARLATYHGTFAKLVQETLRERNLREVLSRNFAEAEPVLNTIHAHALDRLKEVLMEAESQGQALRDQSLVAGLGGLLVFVAISFVVAQAISRPLSGVHDALKQMSTGDFSKLLPKSQITEISAVAAAVEDFRQARDDALSAEKAKANLLTVMSHEMRTPLTGVLGSMELLGITETTSEQDGYLDAMRVSGELLLHHVNEVLELSGLEASVALRKPRSFDLYELVHGLIGSQQATAKSQGNMLELQCDLGRTPFVIGRPNQIQKALLNLVGNALKFTTNGVVSVQIERQTDGNQVEFLVSDTGTGIVPEDLERIFDDFVTLDTSYSRTEQGTGLGLAITRGIVEVLGGHIEAKSEPGKGSQFRMLLPLPQSETKQQETPADESKIPSSRHLLVVEDNDINRVLLAKTLQQMGHQVTVAAGGAEAVETAREGRYDMVLMDISMPEVDGIEAYRRIRAQKLLNGVGVVALTAHVSESDQNRILKAGFSEVATKPISRKELEKLVSRHTNVEIAGLR